MPTTKNAAPVKTVPSRRRFLQSSLASGVGAAMLPALAGARELAPSTSAAAEIRNSELDELTVADLQSGMQSGKFTSRSLVEKYLGRIEEIDRRGPTVNSVIELNPDALAIAEALDKERKNKAGRGPLHGIPVLIKDNIDTADRMQTTAGSLALAGLARAAGILSWRRNCARPARSSWARPI